MSNRQKIVNRILQRLSPRFYDSGYLEPDGAPVRLYAYDEPKELDGFIADVVFAVTAEGIVSAAYAGGMVITPWAQLPIEDLRLLESAL